MNVKRHSPATVTLVPRGLTDTPERLDDRSGADLINRLTSQLNRAKLRLSNSGLLRAFTSNDWLVVGLHNEFDPPSRLYQWHYHGVSSGQYIAVLEELRAQRAYRYETRDRVRDRVRMSRKALDNLPSPLGYPWQLFWPSRARGDGSDDLGFNQIQRRKRRLPEPFHTQMLLWFDRHRLEDMTLLLGLRAGPNGLVKTYVKT